MKNTKHTRQNSKQITGYEAGLTLIELMISMVLGLLITAAAFQMFISSQRGLANQSAGSDIMNNAVFGIDGMVKSIRAANYGALRSESTSSKYVIKDDTLLSGLVLTTDDNKDFDTTSQNLESILHKGSPVSTDLLSCAGGLSGVSDASLKKVVCQGNKNTNGWTGVSNIKDVKSDQLVVMYQSPMQAFDCEGNTVNKDQYVIERYFLRADTVSHGSEPNSLALVCDAGTFDYTDDTYANNSIVLNNYGDAGQIILERVEHFHFQMGVNSVNNMALNGQDAVNNQRIRYYDLADYLKLTSAERNRIASIRFSVLVRSNKPAQTDLKPSEQEFTMLNQTGLKLAAPGSTPYARKVYSSSVAFRSARGI